MKRLAIVVGVVGLAASMSLAGCRAGSGATDGPWNPSVVKADALSAELAKMPLAPYRFTGKESVTQARAIDVLASRCLARFGLAMPASGQDHWEKLEAVADAQDLVGIGLVDEVEAASKGYHGGPGDDPGLGDQGSLDPQAEQVLRGTVSTFGGKPVPRGGCRTEARTALAQGDNQRDVNWATLEALNSSTRVRTDAHFADAVKKWRDCMAESGYHYDSPMTVGEKFNGQRLSDTEVKVAVTDVRCKDKANYLGVYLTLWRKYQQASLDANAAVYAELRKTKEQILAKAAQVLAS